MKKLVLLLCLSAMSLGLTAQNIGTDLQRVIRLAPAARTAASGSNNPALDTIVLTLAYYGGMPDDTRIKALLSGPELLAHYADNAAVREFLLEEKLDVLLENYAPAPGLEVPDFMAASRREAFLRSLAGPELFSREGLVDLGKIRQTFTTPPVAPFSLKTAATNAATNGPVPSANLINNAIAGLSDWISRRAQEELTYTFLNKLRDDIQRNDLNFLFPKTSQFLPSLDLLNYKAILPSLRKAFTEDLNAIAFNLGQFLEAKDQAAYRDPATYNVFLIYRILDLNMRDVPLADILSFTYSEIARARIDTRCQIDLLIAAADTNNVAYQDILSAFDQYVVANNTLNRQFLAATDVISEQFYNPIFDAVEADDFTATRADSFIERAGEIFLPLDAEKLPLKNNYWETSKDPPAAGIVKSWLRGQEAYAYYEAYPTLTRFDELFGPKATTFSPQERRAAGLTAVREILAQRAALDVYRQQLVRLTDARSSLISLQAEISDQRLADSLAKVSLDEQQTTLIADIEEELAAASPRQRPALRLLQKIAQSILPEDKNARALIAGTRKRLVERVVATGNPNSPLVQKLDRSPLEAADLPPLQQAINATNSAYDALSSALQRYSDNQADTLIRTYQNLTTFETVFGMAQQTFFLLSDSNSDLFLDKRRMAIFQTDPSAKLLLAGMAKERIGRVPNLGNLNADGLTDFLLDFSLYLSDFRASLSAPPPPNLSPEQAQRIQAVSFIANTVQSLLKAPILQQSDNGQPPLSLAERFPAFEKVPEISQELNELFALSTQGEYRYAVENLLNLIKLFDIIPEASKKQQRLSDRRDKLRAQLSDLVTQQDKNLKAIGLTTPTADPIGENLELNKKDQEAIMSYSRVLAQTQTQAEKDSVENAMLTLKVNRVRDELAIVQKKLSKLNPKQIDRFRKNVFKYGTFMADVSTADSAADIQAALNTIALPPGSSQIKRTQASSFELGAYFGAALSQERLVLPSGVEAPELEDGVFGAALFVPVGVSYSTNIGGNKSITFFGSLIDLGAITAFRIEEQNNGTEVDRLPEFKVTNIVAPGLHLMYNFPKSPFSLGIGVQDGPSVRKFTLAGETVQREARSVRGMVTFSVDVPIFRFFNR